MDTELDCSFPLMVFFCLAGKYVDVACVQIAVVAIISSAVAVAQS